MAHTTRTRRTLTIAGTIIAAFVGLGNASPLRGQSADTTALGTVRLNQSVTADGQALPAGTYRLRLTTTGLSPVVGQSPDESRWVEFVSGDTVVARAVATVLSAADMRLIADMPIKSGAVRIQTLKGGEYLRLWLQHDGVHYLVHLPVSVK